MTLKEADLQSLERKMSNAPLPPSPLSTPPKDLQEEDNLSKWQESMCALLFMRIYTSSVLDSLPNTASYYLTSADSAIFKVERLTLRFCAKREDNKLYYISSEKKEKDIIMKWSHGFILGAEE